LIWTVKQQQCFSLWLPDVFLTWKQTYGDIIHLHLFSTSGESLNDNVDDDGVESSSTPKVQSGRPNITDLFDSIAADHTANNIPNYPYSNKYQSPSQTSTVAVAACGPDEIMEIVQAESMKKGWHLHKETFKL
jgi:hypothetical protein